MSITFPGATVSIIWKLLMKLCALLATKYPLTTLNDLNTIQGCVLLIAGMTGFSFQTIF